MQETSQREARTAAHAMTVSPRLSHACWHAVSLRGGAAHVYYVPRKDPARLPQPRVSIGLLLLHRFGKARQLL